MSTFVSQWPFIVVLSGKEGFLQTSAIDFFLAPLVDFDVAKLLSIISFFMFLIMC